jgi:Zn-finger nucleic acid-binding protein
MSRICEECKVMMRLSMRLKNGAEMHSCPQCGKTWIREDTIIKKTAKVLSYSASASR